MLEILFTPREVASSLKLSLSTVRRAIGAGHLPCSRVGSKGQIRISQSAIDLWIGRSKISPSNQIAQSTQAVGHHDATAQLKAARADRHGKTADGLAWRIMTADARVGLNTLEAGSVSCIVTSPPYYWQRDYDVEGQIGHENTIQLYVDALVETFRVARRSLQDTGLLFLNIGDAFYNAKGRPHGHDPKHAARMMARKTLRAVDGPGLGLPRKSLIGLPWRVALGLQADGWTLRSAVIWNRPGALGEPTAKDRPHRAYEFVFILAKSPKYYFNRDGLAGEEDIWTIRARPDNPFAHCAPFPAELVDRCLSCGCVPGGLVLDPFVGSGTTLLSALRSGRSAVGIELNDDFAAAADSRMRREFLDVNLVGAATDSDSFGEAPVSVPGSISLIAAE